MKRTNVKNRNKGITLIALVITIIVMLILVAVTINMAINGGLFNYAGKATGDTKNAVNEEQQLANGQITIGDKTYNSIDEYLNDDGTITGVDGEKFSPIYEATKEYKDKNGDIAVIPKGFSVGKSDGINTVANGLVIQDKDGNQFVWIPVAVTESEKTSGPETSIASFYRSDWSSHVRGTMKYTDTTGSSYNEPYANGYTEEVADYNEMLQSVKQNGGFYIGRFEAGTTEKARTNTANGTSRKADGTIDLVVKRDAYPYNYVGWGKSMKNYTDEITYNSKNQGLGALALSKGFYKASDNVGVKSTLCYGIQWDAMLDLIKADYDLTNSITWGNYNNNTGDTWKITRPTAKWTTSPSSDSTWTEVGETPKEKASSTSILLTTGANDNFSAKNIFDVAGNAYEWTNESNNYDTRVLRGGVYSNFASSSPASSRGSDDPYYCGKDLAFRPALYVVGLGAE